MSNILVLYFSCSGVSENKANQIASILDCSCKEIKPKTPYNDIDLDWRDKHSRSSLEMNDEDARPQIESIDEDFSKYEYIFIGFPIWWGVEPRAIDTFLDTYDLTGKKIIIFATSGGSPIGYAIKHIKKLYPNLNIINSYLANFKIDKNEIISLLK